MAARPGRIHGVIDVDLPYPRTEEMRLSPGVRRHSATGSGTPSTTRSPAAPPEPRRPAHDGLNPRKDSTTMSLPRSARHAPHAHWRSPLSGAAGRCSRERGSERVRRRSTVSFGYIGDYNGASLLAIAEEQGLWEKHGLDGETQVVHQRPAADPGARHRRPRLRLHRPGRDVAARLRQGQGHRDQHPRLRRPRHRPARHQVHEGPQGQDGRRARGHVRRHDPQPRAGGSRA